ncbi:hypothetical protein [Wolinella succinogenes]|uniref:Uncharacterized protein n=1 Tax=Wolinella succinogenes (strain ATCC 29543 / DSM 1740 / CCUG 13145 / JCM 31913 / LMG 7466 / NCTC 11488 / FDC 602W) TaxID=273121 RepID=Q7MQS8_WOLSU|nr:hypothetical protein [Wolinella succinogenes]CAE11035.1 hypothetical protein WS2034 [Wolinella succinogenes]VEG81199.1 Uncharacterised protein [Wolinella succinogenes]HCZ19093.1 hypothetical protein [Helicobacter sp.]
MTKQSYKKQVLRGFLKDVETVGANTAKQGSFTCKNPMCISFTELELTLLASFNVYQFLNEQESKEELKEAVKILIGATLKDTPINSLLMVVNSILGGTFIKDLTGLLLDYEQESEDFKTCAGVILDYHSKTLTDKKLLQAMYKSFMELAHSQTDGNEALVLEAMENIEALQELLHQN